MCAYVCAHACVCVLHVHVRCSPPFHEVVEGAVGGWKQVWLAPQLPVYGCQDMGTALTQCRGKEGGGWGERVR